MTTHIVRISLSEPERRGGTFHHVGEVGDFSELLKECPELLIVQPGYTTSAIEVLSEDLPHAAQDEEAHEAPVDAPEESDL